MPDPSQDTSTLKGFDIVLALTETAINNQLKLLYNTPAKALPLPPPGAVQPPTSYLINHRLNLQIPLIDSKTKKYRMNPDGTIKYAEGGISGWIAPPEIRFDAKENLKARVVLKFIKDPDAVGGNAAESVFKVWHSDPGEEGYWDPQTITGYELSWLADLSSKTIQSVQELASLPDDVHDTVTGYVNNRDFTVSAIFCLMNSVQIINNLQVKDAAGTVLTEDPLAIDFVKALVAWFGYELAANGMTPVGGQSHSGPGNPHGVKNIPKNPFVLGYGISQNLPPAPGVPVFAPRRFVYTTNQASGGQPGALNFCMISKDDRVVDPNTDRNAGNFLPSLPTSAGINSSDPDHLEADGVMAISNGLFFDQYIVPFFINKAGPIDFEDQIRTATGQSNLLIKGIIGQLNNGSTSKPNHTGPKYSTSGTWNVDVPAHDTMRRGLAIQERSFWNGSHDYTLTSSSDPIPTGNHGNDVQRRGYITIDCTATMHYYAQTNTRGGLDSMWSYMEQLDIKMTLKAVYTLYATDQGRWFLELDRAKSFLPTTITDGDGKKTVAYTKSEPPAGATTGIWIWGYAENYFGVFGGNDLGSYIEKFVGWGASDVADLVKALNQSQDELQFKVILPAGNVFSFKGINVDGQGNLLCPVTYKSVSTGSNF